MLKKIQNHYRFDFILLRLYTLKKCKCGFIVRCRYCFIIKRGQKAVKSIYLDDKSNPPVIKYQWTSNNYEALPFLTEPENIPHQGSLVSLRMQSFFRVDVEEGRLVLKQSIPKPYPAPGEFEIDVAAKKDCKQRMIEKVEQMKQEIIDLEKKIDIVDYLEVEYDDD